MKTVDINVVAAACHEANRLYCRSIGDTTQPLWIHASGHQRVSAKAGVEFHLANPDSKPEDSHNSWLKHKQDAGWTYGEVKDEVKKTHPCIRPYNELPKAQQHKDKLFIQIVRMITCHR